MCWKNFYFTTLLLISLFALQVKAAIPEVTIESNVYSAFYGNTVRLGCMVQSTPPANSVTWRKTQPYGCSSTVTISGRYSGGTMFDPSLTVYDVNSNDEALYTCSATNSDGTAESSAIFLYLQECIPRVSVSSSSYSVNYGQSVKLLCYLTNYYYGFPPPTIHWQKINKGVKTDIYEYTDRNKYSGSTLYNPSLTILNADSNDAGTYTCFAYNNCGITQSSGINLLVIDTPCFNHKIIDNAEKRSIDYKLSSDDTPISDNELKPYWYRIISQNGDGMATKPPGVNFCGTNNPIWLNGSLPVNKESNLTVTACKQTESSICHNSFDIDVIKCDSFIVYKLTNTTENSSYCFGSGLVRCEEGLSSETGFYPGCSASYPKETVYPNVNGMLLYGEDYNVGQNNGPSLIPVFHCRFEEVSYGNNYVYDILWFINGDLVAHRRNVHFDNIYSTTLKGDEWGQNYSMNMEVSCTVRLRYSVDSVPSLHHHSSVFHAGLFPEKHEYAVIEGESVTIRMTATMPVGCITNNTDYRAENCKRQIYAYVPNSKNATSICSNDALNNDIVLSSCGITLKSTNETQIVELVVYGFNDGLYNSRARQANIKALPTNSSIPSVIDIWSSFDLPEIKVTVIDRDSTLSGRVCQSYTDPHIKTFDGKTYRYMGVGEFVLYRNDKGPYWVHALFTNCNNRWPGPSCHCGIAIRSRNSLFVLRTCQTVSKTRSVFLRQPHSQFRSCNDADLRIVQNGRSYQITLPIGTEIRFTVSSKFINWISVKPSIYDINEAKGLCGVPSIQKDPTDDFINRDTKKISQQKEFANSWRIAPKVRPEEQLFILFPSFDIDNGNDSPDNSSRYCVCEADSYHCNLTQISSTCSGSQNRPNNNPLGSIVTTCETQLDREKRSAFTQKLEHKISRRSVDDTDDIFDIPTFDLDDDVGNNDDISIDDAVFKNGWTGEKANRTCYEQIKSGNLEEIYRKFGGVSIDDYIYSCILDIKLTSTTEFLEDIVDAIQTFTLIEVLRNETILFSSSEGDTGNILDSITNQLCPRNCSSNGTCAMGLCNCFDGFAGDDCSEDVTLPPMNISLPASGLCGKETRACIKTNINGYFPFQNVTCRILHSQIHNKTVANSPQEYMVKAEYRNLYMVSVNLDIALRNRRAVSETPYLTVDKYELSLSNDGTTFGESVVFLAYNEKCNHCDNATKICTIINSCPYITTTKPTTSMEPTTVQQHTSDYSDDSLWISVIVGATFTVAAIIIIIVCIVMRTRRLKSTNKNRPKKGNDIRSWEVYQRKRPVLQRYPIPRPTRPYIIY